MKIYTQTGDGGKTSLLSGERVSKSDIRIHAYGEIDELNSIVGALTAALTFGSNQTAEQLTQIQSDLFHLGAWLATTPSSEPQDRLTAITEAHSRRLEALIDAMDLELPELRAFILPGGHPSAAWSHVARTVCRRAERAVIDLKGRENGLSSDRDDLTPIIVFLNRLSDYFFVLARFLNFRAGVADVLWQAKP